MDEGLGVLVLAQFDGVDEGEVVWYRTERESSHLTGTHSEQQVGQLSQYCVVGWRVRLVSVQKHMVFCKCNGYE